MAFRDYCEMILNEAKGIPADLKKLGGKNLAELQKEVKSEIGLDINKCEFKKVNAKIVKRVQKSSDVLDGTLYFITCLDTGGSNNNVALAYFSRKGGDTFSAGPDVEYIPDDFWNLLEEDDTYTYQVIPQGANGLNEAVTKGIPADVIRSADDLPSLIKSFNKQTKDRLGRAIDMKKCTFKTSKVGEFTKAVRDCKKLDKPRFFLVSTNYGDDDDTVAYAIVSNKGLYTDFSGKYFDTNSYEYDEFERIGQTYIQEFFE